MGLLTLVRQFNHQIKPRMARSWAPILAIAVLVLLLSVWIYQFAVAHGIPPEDFTSDPDAISGQPLYIGSISFINIILWSMAASFSFMGAILLFRKSRQFWFLLLAGVFTSLLLFDDAFQIHLFLLPVTPHYSEIIIYLFYLLFSIGFLLYFLPDILSDTDFPILGMALLSMALSICFDILEISIFVGDILKLLGIAFWLTYFCKTAINWVELYRLPAQNK